MKTIKFFTLGCKVNQYDTQSIREQFIRAGFKEIDNGRKADIYVINTCSVTQRADAESFNLMHRAKKESPGAKIIVTGCLAELDSQKIYQENGIALIVKNQDKNQILDLFNRQTGRWFDKLTMPRTIPSEVEGPANRQTGIKGISHFKSHTRAFLKIQDGCNNFCSYCKVPLVRGRPRSRPLNEIMEEARNLIKNGFKEIVLCGICLGAYGKDLLNTDLRGFAADSYGFKKLSQYSLSLIDVISALENIKGLLRIRLSSIELNDISDELINKMRQSKKLCRHLHIPLQSGDDEILKKMNRNYSADDYLNIIKKIKKHIAGVAITTDILVGFPLESEINFKNTLGLVRKISPLKVHIFPYSPRKGTAAYNFQDKISPAIIKERILRLKKISADCAFKFKKQFLNQALPVLIESRTKENLKLWQGHTDNYIKVRIKSEKNLKNELVTLRLKKINNGCLES